MANPTTNYGFVLPTPTDLVTDLPADFDVALQGVDTRLKALQPGTTSGDLAYSSATANTNVRLPIGTAGQVLAVSGGVPAWTTTADVTPLTTKGDLFTFTTVDARLAVGANNTILMADSTAGTGLKYAGTYTDYTPTVTAGGGTFTTVSATSRFLVIGKMCHWWGKVTITTVGTAAGAIIVTTPVSKTTSAGTIFIGSAEETSVIGFGAFLLLNSTTAANILKPDFTSAIGAGNVISFNITYEVA